MSIGKFNISHKAWHHAMALAIMMATSVVYFLPQIQNKVLLMGDVISGAQAQEEGEHYGGAGAQYFWSNGQFAGMPELISVSQKYNPIRSIVKALKLGFKDPIGMFFLAMLFMYILLANLGVPPIVACLLAICASLNTGQVLLYSAGHYSKVATLIFTPLLILGGIYLYDRHQYLRGFIVLFLGLSCSLTFSHPQMTYYTALFFVVLGLVYLYRAIQQKNLKSFGIAVAISLAAVVLSLGLVSTKLLSVYDYQKHSLRGPNILPTEQIDGAVRGSNSGLDWDYAMAWSNDYKELISAFLVPGVVGGSGSEKVRADSESFKKYRMEKAPLYWGALPFTAGPMYMGVSLTLLFVMGLLLLKGDLKWWFGIGVGVMILLSMGRFFGSFNKLLFDYLPLYNKFRTPQSILSTVAYYLPVLGALALVVFQSGITIKKKSKKSSKDGSQEKFLTKHLGIAMLIVGTPVLLLCLFGGSIFSFDGAADARYVQQGVDIDTFQIDRKSLLRGDALRSLVIVVLIGGVLLAYIKGKIKANVCFLVVGLICVSDVWGVSKRYVSHNDFISQRQRQQAKIGMRDVDQQILNLEEKRESYRVQDQSIDTYNSSATSAHHNTIGGMHAAKLKRYGDIIHRHIQRGNQSVYNMLNTKYFIQRGEQGPVVRRNAGALGNAWFVQEALFVDGPMPEIDALNDIDPSQTAVIAEDQRNLVEIKAAYPAESQARIELVSYVPDRLVYQTNTSTEQLAVFSEVWYNGNRDWVSYIDGERVDHLRANYILRALPIPVGEHEVVFEFKPVVYATGERISLISLLIILGILGFLAVRNYPSLRASLLDK